MDSLVLRMNSYWTWCLSLNAVSVYWPAVRNQEDVTWAGLFSKLSCKILQHHHHFNTTERSWPVAHMGTEEMQMRAWSGTEVTLVFRRSLRCINFLHNAACVSLRDTSSNALICSVQVDERAREREQEKGHEQSDDHRIIISNFNLAVKQEVHSHVSSVSCYNSSSCRITEHLNWNHEVVLQN